MGQVRIEDCHSKIVAALLIPWIGTWVGEGMDEQQNTHGGFQHWQVCSSSETQTHVLHSEFARLSQHHTLVGVQEIL